MRIRSSLVEPTFNVTLASARPRVTTFFLASDFTAIQCTFVPTRSLWIAFVPERLPRFVLTVPWQLALTEPTAVPNAGAGNTSITGAGTQALTVRLARTGPEAASACRRACAARPVRDARTCSPLPTGPRRASRAAHLETASDLSTIRLSGRLGGGRAKSRPTCCPP